MTTTEPTSERCAHCGMEEFPHAKAEADGQVNHRWSPTGQLIPVDRSARARRPASSPILVVGAIDSDLRRILLDKGILTNEDFASLLGARTGADGDRGAGQAPQPE